MDSSYKAPHVDVSGTTTGDERGTEIEPVLVPVPEVGQATAAPLANISSRLNPFAREWDIWTEQTPEEERSLFLTFAYGHPLTQSQIRRFFTNKYGQYVERVHVNWQEPSIYGPPLFGRIVFKASCMPLDVLNGYQQTRFMVDEKPLWCKKFRPMPNHSYIRI